MLISIRNCSGEKESYDTKMPKGKSGAERLREYRQRVRDDAVKHQEYSRKERERNKTDKVLGIKHTNFLNISNLTLHQFGRMAHIYTHSFTHTHSISLSNTNTYRYTLTLPYSKPLSLSHTHTHTHTHTISLPHTHTDISCGTLR